MVLFSALFSYYFQPELQGQQKQHVKILDYNFYI